MRWVTSWGKKTSGYRKPYLSTKLHIQKSRIGSFQSQHDDWRWWSNPRSNNNGAVWGIHCTPGITAGVLCKLIQLIHMTIFLGTTPPPPWSSLLSSSSSSLKQWRKWGCRPRSCRSPDCWIRRTVHLDSLAPACVLSWLAHSCTHWRHAKEIAPNSVDTWGGS